MEQSPKQIEDRKTDEKANCGKLEDEWQPIRR